MGAHPAPLRRRRATTPLEIPDLDDLLVTTRAPNPVFVRGYLEAVRDDEVLRVAADQSERGVKVGESAPDPTAWLLVGMAKRGGAYNAAGAVGWEWFDLDRTESGVPAIDWRGPVPPEGRGYECALGEDDVGAEGVGDCIFCHAGAAGNDYVLSDALALSER